MYYTPMLSETQGKQGDAYGVAGFNMYLDRLGQLIRACLSYYIALHGQKERLYMSANESKLYTFKEREWVDKFLWRKQT